MSGISAVRADLYDDYLNSTSKQPFVAFLARSGTPGHAFVGVGVKLNAGLLVYERFFGYYPGASGAAEQAKLVLGRTTGALEHKWADTSWDVSFTFNIDDNQRKKALAVADKWKQSDPQYNLFAQGGKNCNSFAAEVATAVGLKAPPGPGTTLPPAYIQKLKDANP
jgi:hypothetical protein